MILSIDSIKRIGAYLLVGCGVLLITLLYIRLPVNSATVSLTFVFLVLLSSLFGGLGPGLFSSLLGALCFNYFFLPPKFTLNIDNPQDWVAFATFLVSAITVSGLSSTVKKRAMEAEIRSDEMSKVHDLSKILIELHGSDSDLSSIARFVIDVFGLQYCAIYLSTDSGMWQRISVASHDASGIVTAVPLLSSSPITLNTLLEEYESGVRYVVTKSEQRTIAILALKPGSLPWQTVDTIANLLALSIDRSRLLAEFGGRFASC